ncbi:Hypothetical protein R9X50_00725800 [Acrodontium crateriforme]|uniref:Glucanase n=1 Tax=Acrodontium crateriforme TaxID=150365 RepID=A0AAQ3MBI4_9PEZI|nr:Hypothetical protein R9X50_00725800 [Acrodontium crateriforme]
MSSAAYAILSLASLTAAQLVGTKQAETHPSLTWSKCSAGGSCATQNGKVVIDANWRWVYDENLNSNCYTGNTWNAAACPDDKTCAANCALQGASYESTYGVTTSGSSLKLDFVTQSSQKNVGSRMYLMADDSHYEEFTLNNMEFTFDVDVSKLPCGVNGALYFVSMDADGGMSKYPTNKAGAAYGTGYCDSQCPRDLKFINGQGNVEGWNPSATNPNTGTGGHGSCCAEMDIWEANSISNAVTPHPCDTASQTMCLGDNCGGTYSSNRYAGTCDPDGCDFNPYRMGVTNFFGPARTVDTNSVFTVVTQFITDTGTASGTLKEIRRLYVQNGKVINNVSSKVAGVTGNSLTSAFCDAQKKAFGDTNTFDKHGGFKSMSAATSKGMVLVMSLWDDSSAARMLWLDGDYPTTKASSTPGVARGTCPADSGKPSDVESSSPNAYVTFSNIKFGPLGSTYGGSGSNPSSSSASTLSTKVSTTSVSTQSSTSGATQTHYGQCGGEGYTGPTTCASPYTCKYASEYYSQCL